MQASCTQLSGGCSLKFSPTQINVYPLEHEKAKASVTATHTTQPKDGVPSRKDRRHELYKPRGQEAAAEPAVAV